jgi:hypothetical protein
VHLCKDLAQHRRRCLPRDVGDVDCYRCTQREMAQFWAALPRRAGQPLRVRVEIMGSPKCRIVGKYQPVLTMINPSIINRAHRASTTQGWAAVHARTRTERVVCALFAQAAGGRHGVHLSRASIGSDTMAPRAAPHTRVHRGRPGGLQCAGRTHARLSVMVLWQRERSAVHAGKQEVRYLIAAALLVDHPDAWAQSYCVVG